MLERRNSLSVQALEAVDAKMANGYYVNLAPIEEYSVSFGPVGKSPESKKI